LDSVNKFKKHGFDFCITPFVKQEGTSQE